MAVIWNFSDGTASARDIAIYDVGDLIFWTSFKTTEICYSKLVNSGDGEEPRCFGVKNVVPDRLAIHQESGTLIFSNYCEQTLKNDKSPCSLLYYSSINGDMSCPIGPWAKIKFDKPEFVQSDDRQTGKFRVRSGLAGHPTLAGTNLHNGPQGLNVPQSR